MRAKLAVLLALTTLASVAACGTSTDPSSTRAFDPATCAGGTLTVLNRKDTTHLDPARLYTSGGGNIPSLLFRTLTTRNRAAGADGAKVVPDLATDIGTPSDDARTWTYHLRDGLQFDDGSAITSADVKYGIERSFAEELPGGAPYLHDYLVGGKDYKGPYKQTGGLESIEVPDAKTIVFRLVKPVGDFPFLATATQFAPVPQAKDKGVNYENKPVSSGPYKVETYEKKKQLTLVRNEHWSRGVDPNRLGCPDRIEIKSGLDGSVITQRLITGAGADATAVTTDTDLSPADLPRVTADPDAAKRLARGHFPYVYYLAFNTKIAPFDNLKVRQAFSYAVNRTTVVNAVGGTELADAATTFLPPQPALGYKQYDHFPAGPTGNVTEAKRLLAEAGFPNGFAVTLAHTTTPTSGTGPEVAAAIQEALGKIGVKVTLGGVDASEYSEKNEKPATEPALFLSGWGADWPAGGPFLVPIFDGRQILADGGNYNSAQYDDPATNAAFDELGKLTDAKAAAPQWGELDEKIGRQALVVPLFHGKDLYVVGKGVKNAFISDWTGIYDLSQLSVK